MKFPETRTARDLERAFTHLDLDYELALYGRRKMWWCATCGKTWL